MNPYHFRTSITYIHKNAEGQSPPKNAEDQSGTSNQATQMMADPNPTHRLTTVLLNGENYQSWARSATISLIGRGKIGFINGEIKSPRDKTNPQFKEWQMIDSLVLSWLLNSIEPSISNLFIYSENSKDLWNSLKDMYGNQNNYSHIFSN